MTELPSLDHFLSHLEVIGKLTTEAAQRVRGVHRVSRQPVDIIIRELGLLQEAAITRELSQFLAIDAWSGPLSLEGSSLLETLGLGYARENAVIPQSMTGDRLLLIAADPFDKTAIETVGYFFDRDVDLALAQRSWIDEQIEAYSKAVSEETVDALSLDQANEMDLERLVDIARDAPIVKFVSRIIQQAVDERATDIHIEPQSEVMRVRLRRDGLLMATENAPIALHPGTISRLKILARLNIAERRLPQDGKLRVAVRGQEVDLRLSVMPTVHGETAVLRVLDRQSVSLDLAALGYSQDAIAGLQQAIARPNGLILVTGPTGSGKTTTLYAILNALNRPEVKIFTVEDPVEYRFAGITQLQIDPSIGLSFATALRSVLRQDPDVILVGEIRDRETAEIAVQAALTGHLVLSTLHTNSAIGAFSRLRDMGVEPFLLEATTRCVIGQRLVRQSCGSCESDLGCATCGGTGYVGRRAAYEILHVSNAIKGAVLSGLAESDFLEIARREGMVPLREHAEALVRSGQTSMNEVIRVIEPERL
ncbi:general secretion pathway protein E, GspE (plasmid) [Ensifer adhaerens OV14]|nr:general secretion pathway protein E, GspE [Ensifer adhaerens OV14]